MMKKKVLSLFLALVMVLGLLPVGALAVDPAQHHMVDAAVAFLSGSSWHRISPKFIEKGVLL